MYRDYATRLYEAIANDEDARVCKDIPESACSNVPANFVRIVVSNALSKLGDSIVNPKTVLAWIMSAVGAPLYLVALLVPIRESGSMLPQLVIASLVRRQPRRKWFWVAGSIVQGMAVVALGLVATMSTGATAGWLIVSLLVLFSLARGMCSVASKDVIGKTVPKTRRGRLNGLSTTLGGLLALAVAVLLLSRGSAVPSPGFYSGLLLTGAGMWLLAALVFARIEETPGETGGGGNALTAALTSLGVLRSDAPFRRFVIARSLLLCSALSAPYYVILAQQTHGSDFGLLGSFVLASALAESLSATFWGYLADRSSRTVMLAASLMAAVLGLIAALIAAGLPSVGAWAWTYPTLFFALGIAHSGVRLGRKTYVLDLAGGQRRSDYVAVSNSVVGLVLLLAGSIGALSSVVPTYGVILALSLMGLAGTALVASLPEVTA